MSLTRINQGVAHSSHQQTSGSKGIHHFPSTRMTVRAVAWVMSAIRNYLPLDAVMFIYFTYGVFTVFMCN
jgi:hypothetical protein